MTNAQERRKKARTKALAFGAASLSLYAAVFAFADAVTPLFARGGAYSLLPVATVFVFSYVHANFAGNVWTALGIEASSKIGRTTAAATAKKRADKRPRATLQA